MKYTKDDYIKLGELLSELNKALDKVLESSDKIAKLQKELIKKLTN